MSQTIVPPQPSAAVPQVSPCSLQLLGVQAVQLPPEQTSPGRQLPQLAAAPVQGSLTCPQFLPSSWQAGGVIGGRQRLFRQTSPPVQPAPAQSSVAPQPSLIVPHSTPAEAQVTLTHC